MENTSDKIDFVGDLLPKCAVLTVRINGNGCVVQVSDSSGVFDTKNRDGFYDKGHEYTGEKTLEGGARLYTHNGCLWKMVGGLWR